ncbi:Aspartyl-tRNA(Asn)/glutamyl-tRNA(Gln) amidotransferase subunit A OS=Castellaniella defragrans OX=75697 GN=HNR28_001829 PE=4 SV=1 [Castellaniella defragrans]
MSADLIAREPAFSERRTEFLQGGSTPRAYLETCIDAITHAESDVGAFTHLDIARARKQADASTQRYRAGRPLSVIDGMPIGVKDIIDTVDMPTRMNSEIYDSYTPTIDAPAVWAARAGGAVILGKTVTTEFAIGRPGPTVNPHDVKHTPGGSSSGSAAGVASGMVAAAFATQTNGSILRPASFCGVVGYKPTIDRLSTEGVHPLSRTNDHLGVMARSVTDAWWLARWVSEKAPQKGGFGLAGPLTESISGVRPDRVAVMRTSGFGELDAASLQAFDRQLERLAEAGVSIAEPAEDPALRSVVDDLDSVRDRSLEVLAYEMQARFSQYAERYPGKLSERVLGLVERGRTITRTRYCDLLLSRDCSRRKLAALADAFDAFVLPSSSGPAPEGLAYTGSRTLLMYASFTGLPAFSVPVMQVDHLPFGLQIIGAEGADYPLARFAQWVCAQAGDVDGL